MPIPFTDWNELFETQFVNLPKKYPLLLLGIVGFCIFVILWKGFNIAVPQWVGLTIGMIGLFGLACPMYRTQNDGFSFSGYRRKKLR